MGQLESLMAPNGDCGTQDMVLSEGCHCISRSTGAGGLSSRVPPGEQGRKHWAVSAPGGQEELPLEMAVLDREAAVHTQQNLPLCLHGGRGGPHTAEGGFGSGAFRAGLFRV